MTNLQHARLTWFLLFSLYAPSTSETLALFVLLFFFAFDVLRLNVPLFGSFMVNLRDVKPIVKVYLTPLTFRQRTSKFEFQIVQARQLLNKKCPKSPIQITLDCSNWMSLYITYVISPYIYNSHGPV